MAEYIKREALIDAVESIDWYSVYKGKLTAGAPNTENALYKASSIYAVIDNAPSADVAPVVHGRLEKQSGLYSCSECGMNCPYDVQADVIEYWTCKYCPNCGAKMDGGDGNNAIT